MIKTRKGKSRRKRVGKPAALGQEFERRNNTGKTLKLCIIYYSTASPFMQHIGSGLISITMAARKYETQNIVSSTVSDAFRKPSYQIEAEHQALSLDDLENMDLENMTPKQLETVTTRLLWNDRRKRSDEGGQSEGVSDNILFHSQLHHRRRAEVSVGDPIFSGENIGSMTSGEDRPGVKKNTQMPIYNRAHPQGRKIHTKKQRTESGASFYR